jgi:hypothetical protein
MADDAGRAKRSELVELRRRLATIDGSDDAALRELYARLVARVGADSASRLWWAAFAASDATET